MTPIRLGREKGPEPRRLSGDGLPPTGWYDREGTTRTARLRRTKRGDPRQDPSASQPGGPDARRRHRSVCGAVPPALLPQCCPPATPAGMRDADRRAGATACPGAAERRASVCPAGLSTGDHTPKFEEQTEAEALPGAREKASRFRPARRYRRRRARRGTLPGGLVRPRWGQKSLARPGGNPCAAKADAGGRVP